MRENLGCRYDMMTRTHICSAVMTACPFRRVWLVLPLPARFITGSGSPAVNNLCEYSCSHLPPGRRPNQLSELKPVVGPFMTDDCLIFVVILTSDGRPSLLLPQHEMTKQQIQQTGSQFSHRMYFLWRCCQQVSL